MVPNHYQYLIPFFLAPYPYKPYQGGYYTGYTNTPPPLPSPAFYVGEQQATHSPQKSSLEYFNTANKVIQEASSEVSQTYSDAENDENVIVIHEHHHHHHHKNVTEEDDKQLDDREGSDNHNNYKGDDEFIYSPKYAKPALDDNVLEHLLEMLTARNYVDYLYEDWDGFFNDDETHRRSAVYARKNKEEERKYKRIAEIYRDLYSDYYTAYVRKAGYEAFQEEADDGIEEFIENGYQPIVEIEMDL